jgi:hypothetical protein
VDSYDTAPKVVRIFESYGWNDAADIAERLKDSLEGFGYQVWIDREHLRADDKHFSLALEEAVSRSEVIVALLSPHSVRGQTAADTRSSICYNELRLAEELQRPIVPVTVRKFTGPPPFLIIKYRRVDWLDWETPESYHKGLSEITTMIEQVLAHESLFDRDIAFQVSNFAAQLNTAADTFTGRGWLFDRIDTWLAGSGRALMIEGATGSGKTAVVAELVRRNPNGRLLAYHFCTPAVLTLDSTSFVRSLASMLAASVDAYGEKLFNGELARWLSAADPDTMLRQGILEPLRDIAMDDAKYIVVDALDEAVGAADGTVSLPQLLSDARAEFPPWLRLLVTSRPHQRIQRLFRGAEVCSLDDGNDDQGRDVRAFVDRRIAELPDASAATQPDTVRRQIDDRAGANFQYATTILDSLASGELRPSQLDHLPHTLEDVYYQRAERRFPQPGDYRPARAVLETLLAAREPLGASLLGDLTGLDHDSELQPALDAISGFADPQADAWRIAHKSIADWLTAPEAGRFRLDPEQGRRRLLAHCEGWAGHHEPYALKYLVTHLLEADRVADALACVRHGLFAQRAALLREPRLDAEDSRNLTAALIAAQDQAGIVALAQTASTWQRDGVAAALQSGPAEALPFIDGVVGALLAVTP